MIYISSSCVSHKKIKDSVRELVDNGFKNIELSGGTQHYNGYLDDLLELKDKYHLNYLCHNYFPPPRKSFVLNLASLNNEIYQQSLAHYKKAIKLSKKLGARKYAFHAGFFVDISVNEIGKKISRKNSYNKNKAIQQFCSGFNSLKEISNGLDLYIENNVYSISNAKTYCHENIFMLTSLSDYNKLKSKIDFNLLLDIAHLKVSLNTLNLNFEEQFKTLIKNTNYIHISENDALHDLNNKLDTKSYIIKLLDNQSLDKKDITLEVYADMRSIKQSYEILKGIYNA